MNDLNNELNLIGYLTQDIEYRVCNRDIGRGKILRKSWEDLTYEQQDYLITQKLLLPETNNKNQDFIACAILEIYESISRIRGKS